MFEDASYTRFLFKHFNNSDYVAGISENYMILMKINTTIDEYLMLSKDDAVITLSAEPGKPFLEINFSKLLNVKCKQMYFSSEKNYLNYKVNGENCFEAQFPEIW